MAKLVIRSGHPAGAEYAVKDALVHLGRRSQSDVPINDTKASREHAVIRDEAGVLFLQDLSRNGTGLNDKPALKTAPGSPLKFGDKIKIGDTILELVDEKSEPIDIDIPGYTILEKVGSGGMGSVYKARQLSMDRIVALKVLNERYSNNAEFVDRFIREARAAGKLNHPNVIHVHDISRANGRHYFSMEFIDGPSVRELLKKEKRIEINKALDIVLQAAKALEFAHENRIVHRDIKPDNIMLTREGIVKLADLGIAKTFEEGGASPKEGRGVLGTPHYMAPEQALGKAIDHRVDIYSLGATFYHMSTGQTPFSGANAQEILKAHVQGSLLPIQDLNHDIPDPVCFIIERMMAKLPEKRYQNMDKLIEDIERVQSGQVKGIERIDATDSSVLRPVKAQALQPAAGAKDKIATGNRTSSAKTRVTRERNAEITTGLQIPIGKIINAVFWLAMLAGAVAAIIYLPKHFGANGPDGGENKKKPPAQTSNAEARAWLLEAKTSLAGGDTARAENLLRRIRLLHADSAEGEEANGLLAEVALKSRDQEKQKAENMLAEVQKFETANPQKPAEILARYKEILAIPGGPPSVYSVAKIKIEQYDKPTIGVVRTPAPPAGNVTGSAKEALEKAGALKDAGDFDGARKALKDFIYSTQNLEDAAEGRKQLAKTEEAATARIAETTEKTKGLDPLSAAMEWSRYSSTVKDTANADKVKPILEDLEDKTMAAAMDELKKASDAAKENKYDDAIDAMGTMQKKWAGLKWAAMAKSKEASFKNQKELVENAFKLLKEKVAAGPLALPFALHTKIKNQEKWAVSGVREDTLVLDPVPAKAGPGVTAKLFELQPKEQYQLMLFALSKEPSREQHLQLKAFCTERGLADEADKHEKLADAAKN